MKAEELLKIQNEVQQALGSVVTLEAAFAFGADQTSADELASLVKQGIKTATASLLQAYLEDDEEIPVSGELSVVVDGAGEPVCVIEVTRVYITDFSMVSERHAFLEGEGDRTLAHWREEHRKFFQTVYADLFAAGFQEHEKIVCEEFRVVYQFK